MCLPFEKMLFNFILGESSVLKLDFVSDESLDYRGVEIDYINIFKKPEEECDTADLNQDAVIDILDIILLVDRIIYGNISGFEQCLSDINNDGDINIIDIVAVINIIFANN